MRRVLLQNMYFYVMLRVILVCLPLLVDTLYGQGKVAVRVELYGNPQYDRLLAACECAAGEASRCWQLAEIWLTEPDKYVHLRRWIEPERSRQDIEHDMAVLARLPGTRFKLTFAGNRLAPSLEPIGPVPDCSTPALLPTPRTSTRAVRPGIHPEADSTPAGITIAEPDKDSYKQVEVALHQLSALPDTLLQLSVTGDDQMLVRSHQAGEVYLRIYDRQGQVLREARFTDPEYRIAMGDLPRVIFVEALVGQKRYTRLISR